jgi:hypothetical protein
MRLGEVQFGVGPLASTWNVAEHRTGGGGMSTSQPASQPARAGWQVGMLFERKKERKREREREKEERERERKRRRTQAV